jgi:protein-S-isoprenylcysteine O-methyltransferase Ste14
MKTNMITLAGLIALVVWLVLHVDLVAWTPVKLVGAVIAGVGAMFLVTARLQLGASFAVKAKANKLVTRGLYSKIRNPIYVFSALMLVGMAIVLGNWVLGLLVAVVLVPLQVHRARKEDAVLAAAFGEDYERYKAGTWF